MGETEVPSDPYPTVSTNNRYRAPTPSAQETSQDQSNLFRLGYRIGLWHTVSYSIYQHLHYVTEHGLISSQ